MRLFAVTALGLCIATSASAHHPFRSQFDPEAPVVVYGQITGVEWTDPHVRIHVSRYEPDSPGRDWIMEVTTPEIMSLNGMDADTLVPGLRVMIRGHQALDKSCEPACIGNGRDITFEGGTQLYLMGVSEDRRAEGVTFRDMRASGEIAPVS